MTSSLPLSTSKRLAPGPQGHWFWGVVPEFQRDMLGLYHNSAHEFGDVVRLRFGFLDTFAVSHPEVFKHILQDHNKNYVRNDFLINIVKAFVGLNLFTSDGDYWRTRRRLAQPMFHRQRIANFATLMTDAAQQTLARWAALPPDHWLPLEEEMMRLTLQVVGQALFSVDLSTAASQLGPAFTTASEYVNSRLGNLLPLPLFIPTPQNLRFKRALRVMDEVVYRLIRERRQTPGAQQDLLAMLMQAKDEDTGQTLTDQELRDEVAAMMFAGHETTAVTLSWAFYLLSQNPEAERQLHAELATVLAGRAPTLADLPDLRYNKAVIDEALRLYPAAWSLSRQSVNADEFMGYYIPPKASVTLVTWNVHRDPRWWDEPETFKPDRFLPEAEAKGKRPPFAFMPFGGGPRLCIGQAFALTEAQLLLATLAQRYRLRLQPGVTVRPNPIFVLRPSPLPMRLERR